MLVIWDFILFAFLDLLGLAIEINGEPYSQAEKISQS